MQLNISDEKIQEILDWVAYNYSSGVEALAFFDPRGVTIDYPSEDVNILLVLNDVSESTRDRYQLLSGGVLDVILGMEVTTQCRIQTYEELQMLADMQLPLLDIYLKDSFIAYDPNNFLANLYAQI